MIELRLKLKTNCESYFVVMEELSDVSAHVDSWIMTVKAELVVDFMILNPGVETATIPPEADTEQILILSRVTQQE